MRLTLRTLLAYMDDILELEDAQDIAKKIQESERASQLLHRIRDVTQRQRLAAPEVAEQTEGLDPNTVAEYLDNTLPADRVLDFEKVCLDSEIHLAEVASCHQILTLVLGEPAEVDPESRLRMYETLQQGEAPPVVSEPAPPAETPPPVEEVIPTRRAKPTVPDYLRDSSEGRGRRRLTLLVLIALLALCAALLVYEPQVFWGELVAWWQGPGEPAASVVAPSPRTEATPAPTPASTPPSPAPATSVTATAPPANAEIQQPIETPPPTSPPAESPAEALPAPLPPALADKGVAEGSPYGTSAPSSPPVAVPEPAATATTAPPAPMPPAPGNVAPPSSPPLPAPAPEGLAEKVAPPAVAPLPLEEGSPAPAVESLGQYHSSSEILARLNPQTGAWNRVPAQAPLQAGEQLVSLPTYRPALSLGRGGELQLFDGTRISLPRVDAAGIPLVEVAYGRLGLRAGRQPEGRLRLQWGDRQSLISWESPETEMRLQVSRAGVASADPETQPAPLGGDFYVVRGKVSWQEAGAEPLALTAPAQLRLGDSPAQAVAVEKLPAWENAEAAFPLDPQAAQVLLNACTVERPVLLTLREQTENSRREVRWLAMRCLAHLGDFEPMAMALNDKDQSRFWPDYIEQLREGISRGPESAAAVRRAMEKVQGAELYELLWKYRQLPLQPAEAQQLLQYLNHESLAIRVVTIAALTKLYGGASLGYRPTDTAAKRTVSVQRWRERLGINSPTGASPRAKPNAGGEAAPNPPSSGAEF